ncbi:MAG: AI-2E family transporter [Deltaproteobacteria bacterium]|nr:AI-2E family transporter [Deltaproteobacteria bacterium]
MKMKPGRDQIDPFPAEGKPGVHPAPPGGEGDVGERPAPEPPPRRRETPPVDLDWIKAGLAVLAALAVLALLHYAASVFITVFSSLLLAFALEPLVQLLCRRTRLSRQFASAVVVFLFIATLYGILWLAYDRVSTFLSDVPSLVERVRTAPLVEQITSKARELERIAEETTRRFASAQPPAPETVPPQVVVRDGGSFREALFRGLGSVTTVIFSLSFIPFLVYFILADKEPLSRRTRELFSEEKRETAGAILEDIELMMRKFLLGNAIVAGILSAATCFVFWLVGLPYWIVLGTMSGTMSIVPYLGLVLALLPGVLVGLVTFSSGLPFLVVIGSVALFHVIAANLLTPKLVGAGVHLNAVASTVGLLFFGWLWGGMGLLLAIPIVAVLKCVLENIPATRPIGLWLGD